MKITVKACAAEYYPALKEIGYYGLDLSLGSYPAYDEMMAPDYAGKILAKRRAIEDAGLVLCQTHLTYRPSAFLPADGGNYPDFEAYMLPLLEKQLHLVGEMGCNNAVFHPYYELASEENTRRANLTLIEKLMPLLERYNIVLSLENVYGPKCTHAHHSTAEQLLCYTEHFDSPHVGICLDTGHAVIRGQDPVEMLKAIAHRVTALHLHTTLPGFDVHTIPFFANGYERTDWFAFARELKKTPYRGHFNMELKANPSLSRRATELFYRTAYVVAEDILRQSETE